MSEILAALPTILNVAQVGSTGYNLYNQYENQKYQNTLRSDAQNPAKVTALAEGYTQPLTAGLTAAVNNQTQAQLAQAGLSESPQIAQTVEAQAIAPYIQNNQNQGYNLALQALGLGGGAIPPAQQQQNSLSALAKAFSQLGTLSRGPNAAQLSSLIQGGAVPQQQLNTTPYEPDYSSYVQPAQVDTSTYEPDYAAGLS
jgi:hypothetical protein